MILIYFSLVIKNEETKFWLHGICFLKLATINNDSDGIVWMESGWGMSVDWRVVKCERFPLLMQFWTVAYKWQVGHVLSYQRFRSTIFRQSTLHISMATRGGVTEDPRTVENRNILWIRQPSKYPNLPKSGWCGLSAVILTFNLVSLISFIHKHHVTVIYWQLFWKWPSSVAYADYPGGIPTTQETGNAHQR